MVADSEARDLDPTRVERDDHWGFAFESALGVGVVSVVYALASGAPEPGAEATASSWGLSPGGLVARY